MTSGNSANVAYQLNVGLSDLGIVFDPFDVSKYEYTRLPWKKIGASICAKTIRSQKSHSLHLRCFEIVR